MIVRPTLDGTTKNPFMEEKFGGPPTGPGTGSRRIGVCCACGEPQHIEMIGSSGTSAGNPED